MEQYPIPQFIESEGKIISFLTFRQFFVLVGGAGICLALYYTVPFYIFLVLSILVAVIVAGVAFLKIDNVSIVTIVLNFITFSVGSKNYIWKKKEYPYPFGIKNSVRSSQSMGTYQAEEGKLKQTKAMVELRKK